MRATWLLVALLAVTACTSQKKKNKEALVAAQAEQAAALAALRQADTTTAVNHFHEVEARIGKLRRTTAPPMSEDPGEGPVVDGLSAHAWQDLWTQEFKNEIEAQLPALLAATKAGTLDWNTGRGLLTAYRPDLDDQWLDGVKDAARGEVAQRSDAYHLRCASSDEDLCARVAPLLRKKFLHPLDDKRLLELAMEKQMFGAVVIEGAFARYREYANVKDPEKNKVFELPAQLDVAIGVETFQGASSWDGVLRLHAELEPPPAIATSSLREQERAHFDALFQQVLTQLEARPTQSLR